MTEVLIQAKYLGKELARRLGCKGLILGRGNNFSLFQSVQTGLRSNYSLVQQVTGALSVSVKRSGSEDDHSPPTGA